MIDEIAEKADREQEKPSNSHRIIEFPMKNGVIVGCEYIPGIGLKLRRKYIDMSKPVRNAYPSELPPEHHYG